MSYHKLDPVAIGARIREVAGDEPKAFAHDIGISLTSVYNYMQGRIPTAAVLYRMAKHTGRPMEWFLSGEVVEESAAGRSDKKVA